MDVLMWISAGVCALFFGALFLALSGPFVNPIGWLEQRVGGPLAVVIFLTVSVLLVGGLLALSVAIRLQ